MKMNTPLVSIIIPVYNCEKFISRCILSVLSQTYPNIEVMLIDDGSTDNSYEICKEFAKNNKNIKTFYQENNGQGSARNTGILKCNGDYVMFVDADDYIDKNMVQLLFNSLVENKVDISCCSMKIVYDNVTSVISNYKTTIYTKEEALYELCANTTLINGPMCKLMKYNIVANNLFKEKIKYEDADVVYKWFNTIDKLSYIDAPLYNYYQSKESTTRGTFKLNRFDYINVSKEKIAFYEKQYPNLAPYAIANAVDECLNIIYDSRKNKEANCLRKSAIGYVDNLIKNYNLKYPTKNTKIKIKAYKIGWPIFLLLMNIKRH